MAAGWVPLVEEKKWGWSVALLACLLRWCLAVNWKWGWLCEGEGLMREAFGCLSFPCPAHAHFCPFLISLALILDYLANSPLVQRLSLILCFGFSAAKVSRYNVDVGF